MNRSPDRDSSLPTRKRWEGVCNVVRFNWPLYAVGFVAIAVSFTTPSLVSLPHWLSAVLWAGGTVALYLMLASLLVSIWIYDLSPLYQFKWACAAAGPAPQRILNLHSGFDESSTASQTAFAEASFSVMDFYDAQTMTEPSIARARKYQDRIRPPVLTAMTQSVSSGSLPVETDSIDVAFAILAAHEIRLTADRHRFFTELARTLSGDGRLILVEHLRNLPNFLAFGPQFVHFYSRVTWLKLAHDTGFTLVHESRITPFIGLFVFQKTHSPSYD